MISLPSLHGFASILVAAAMFYGFASGRARVEIISLLTIGVIALGLYFFPLPGTAPQDGLALAFGGFGHHALITICALMILGRGLVVTGALDPAARALNRVWRFNRQLGLLVTLALALILSMVINDTPVLVLLLPIMAQLAHQGGMPASKTLIPVNSAILIGGMATTIGTSTNLLVVSIATDMGMAPIGVFHFTGIVLTAALVGAVHHAIGEQTGSRVAVQPMAVTYTGFGGLPIGRELRQRVAWYGDAELIPHFVALLSAGAIDVTISWGDAVATSIDADRKQITRDAEQSVRRMCEAARRAGMRGTIAPRPAAAPVTTPDVQPEAA